MEKERRILLVTFPGQGHINPCLQFAKRLLKTGLKVTLLTGTYALKRMNHTTNPPLQGLTFEGYCDGFEEGTKLGKPFHEMMDDLKRNGTEAVEETIKSFSEKGKPFSHVVYSILIPWAGHVAHTLNVPSTLLWIQPAALLDIYYYYFNGYGAAFRNHGNDPSWCVELPGLPPLTVRDLPSFMIDMSKFDALPYFKEHLDILEMEYNPKVLVNSFDELECEALKVVKNLNWVPIGPLFPSAFLDGRDSSDNNFGGDLIKKSEDYIEWLNKMEKGSVIYVSFGSYFEVPKEQMEEIAKGLIDYGRPFLWVIRKSNNESKKDEEIDKDLIFREELEKKGKIVEWCSQVEVLSHPSIGCFISHCGWNSSLESITCGVPIVCFPLLADQSTNAKLIESVWEVGVRVEKNEEIVEGWEIKRCVEIVMGEGDRGERMRRNCEKWKILAREAAKEGGSSYLNLKHFVDQEIRGVVQD